MQANVCVYFKEERCGSLCHVSEISEENVRCKKSNTWLVGFFYSAHGALQKPLKELQAGISL